MTADAGSRWAPGSLRSEPRLMPLANLSKAQGGRPLSAATRLNYSQIEGLCANWHQENAEPQRPNISLSTSSSY